MGMSVIGRVSSAVCMTPMCTKCRAAVREGAFSLQVQRHALRLFRVKARTLVPGCSNQAMLHRHYR
jgi:hypothetical protein